MLSLGLTGSNDGTQFELVFSDEFDVSLCFYVHKSRLCSNAINSNRHDYASGLG